jgi:cyclophilin family peptidyl-prolyl cis-trans isomerase
MKRRPVFILLQLLALTAICQSSYTFSGKPVYEIDVRRNNISFGKIIIELFPDVAPLHVRNFDSLVAHNFYDTTAFHRVSNKVIQGGDPNSRHGAISTWGFGQPGQPKVKAEFNPIPYDRGMLGAARSTDINSATSQFFICHESAYTFNGKYTLYGQVIDGLEIVDTIRKVPLDGAEHPIQKIEMFVNRIGTNDTLPETPLILEPSYGALEMDSVVQLQWSPVKGALQYQVLLTTDITFMTEVDSVLVWDSTYALHNLQDSTIYYWRVRANNGGNFGVFDNGKFSTKGETTDIQQFNLSRVDVFPNPGNGLYNFTGIPAGSNVKIFTEEGRLLLTKISPTSELLIDLQQFPRGVYFYTVSNKHVQIVRGKLIKQ